MSKSIHICISVRGILNWTRTQTKRNMWSMKKDDGSKFSSVDEFRNAIMDELAAGHEVLPMGEKCEGFDYKKGCPGHEVTP